MCCPKYWQFLCVCDTLWWIPTLHHLMCSVEIGQIHWLTLNIPLPPVDLTIFWLSVCVYIYTHTLSQNIVRSTGGRGMLRVSQCICPISTLHIRWCSVGIHHKVSQTHKNCQYLGQHILLALTFQQTGPKQSK